MLLEFKNGVVAVEIRSQHEWLKLMNILEKETELKWASGNIPTMINYCGEVISYEKNGLCHGLKIEYEIRNFMKAIGISDQGKTFVSIEDFIDDYPIHNDIDRHKKNDEKSINDDTLKVFLKVLLDSFISETESTELEESTFKKGDVVRLKNPKKLPAHYPKKYEQVILSSMLDDRDLVFIVQRNEGLKTALKYQNPSITNKFGRDECVWVRSDELILLHSQSLTEFETKH